MTAISWIGRWACRSRSNVNIHVYIKKKMSRILLNGSPRTAARQVVELLTRDGILDEDGKLRPEEVEAACQYAWRPETKSPAATDGSTASNKSEIPDAKSEPCTSEAGSPRDDTSRTRRPRNS